MHEHRKPDHETETDGHLSPEQQSGNESATPTHARGQDALESTAPVSSPRRPVLKALTLPPIAASLAGCQFSSDETPDEARIEPLEPGETTGYRGAIRFGEVYGIEMRQTGSETPTLTGRFHTNDRYLRFEQDGRVVESYLVDGDSYVVVDGQCSTYPDVTGGVERVADVGDEEPTAPKLTMTETAMLDGRRMFVLTLSAEDQPHGTELTYYVDAETRYIRRLETAATVVDYHSWDDVDPITVPDLDCRSS